METLTAYLSDKSTLLFQWQDLAGSVIGVFGAIMVAFLGFALNHFYQKYKTRRENFRQIEIALALGLNDVYDAERHLNDFLTRLDNVVLQPLRTITTPVQYYSSRTNFPPIAIHLDESLLKAPHNSYYVHNKILIIHKTVSQGNETFKQMATGYENIFEMAKFLITQGANPENQRREYLINNEGFRTFVLDMISQLQIAKKEFAKTKIYNLKFLTKKRLEIWRHESISFKFFRNKLEIEKYKGKLECLDRIDEEIKEEVEKIMKEAEESRISTKIYKRETLLEFLKELFNRH